MNYLERTRKFLDRLNATEEDKDQGRAMLDQFERLPGPAALQARDLEPFMTGARDEQAFNRQIACQILSAVGEKSPVARDCLAALCHDKKAQVRHWALAYLSMDLPREFILDRLRNALRDRSAKIRTHAADTICAKKIVELQDDLEAAARVEKNTKAKRSLEMNLGLLRDGYYVLHREGMKPNLNVIGPNGAQLSRFIRQEDIDAGRVPLLAEELLAKNQQFFDA